MRRRELWETLVDIWSAITPNEQESQMLRVTDVSLNLPIEIELRPTEVGFVLRADLPRWRWNSGFEVEASRLRMGVAIVPTI